MNGICSKYLHYDTSKYKSTILNIAYIWEIRTSTLEVKRLYNLFSDKRLNLIPNWLLQKC